MPWEDVSTYKPCCKSMEGTVSYPGIPYHHVQVKPDGIHVICQHCNIYNVWTFCPFCGKSTVKEAE